MPVPKPNTWPNIFPPSGGFADVLTIANYLNEAIDVARAAHNAFRVRSGNPPLSSEYEWEGAGLPHYPQDGWWVRPGLPVFQIIGPLGLAGFGLHEFQTHDATGQPIHDRKAEMQALALLARGETPTPVEPVLPAEGEPMPDNPTLPPGAPPLYEDDLSPTNPLPPGTPPNLPGTGSEVVNLGDAAVAVEFTGRVKGKLLGVLVEDVALFKFPGTGKIEVVVKRADVPAPNFFFGTMTDVGFMATVKLGGVIKSLTRAEGKPVDGLISF